MAATHTYTHLPVLPIPIPRLTLTLNTSNLTIPWSHLDFGLKMESCCTCATILSEVPRCSKSEKPPPHRRLECCPRIICGNCISRNNRFSQYCPYCQISIAPTALPQGLKEPPAYDNIAPASSENPPPYSASIAPNRQQDSHFEKSSHDEPPTEDVLHFLNHSRDTITSLSLRYGVPAPVLRRVNNVTSDHLLAGRRTVIIPGEFYKGGVSLSPRPIEGEEEELRKGRIRRFMVGCKVSEYDVAVLYLEQSQYDLEAAVATFIADEEWERQHPVRGVGRDKGRTLRRN